MDFNIGELGINKARKLSSTEIIMRRLVAILHAEQAKNWQVASQLEEGQFTLLSDEQRRKMLSQAKMAKLFADKAQHPPNQVRPVRAPVKVENHFDKV